MEQTLAFDDYAFLAKHQVRSQQPNGRLLFMAQAVRECLPADGQSALLDLGGGTNSYLSFVGPGYRKIVGDSIPAAVDGLSEVETVVAELPETGLPTAIADWISALEVIEHMPPSVYVQSLGEIARLSRRFVAISSPFFQHLESAHVQCASCGAIYQCEGHYRRFEPEDIYRLQDHFGGLVRLGFATEPRGMAALRLRYRLKQVRDFLRRMGLQPHARPPFTKCPRCGQEEFHGYETFRTRAEWPDQSHWSVDPRRLAAGPVGNFFLAVFDRHADPISAKSEDRWTKWSRTS